MKKSAQECERERENDTLSARIHVFAKYLFTTKCLALLSRNQNERTLFDHEAHEGLKTFLILTFVTFVCFVVILPLAFDCGVATLG
jgi:hypothetical protein